VERQSLRKTGEIILPDSMSAPTPDQLREAMALLPSAVAIVTAHGPDGPAGATADAVTSLSLDPPLMLACLDRRSRTLGIVHDAGAFGISYLSGDQESIARAFATKAPHTEKFREVPFTDRGGVPILDGALAWVACRTTEVHAGGDHEIFIGEVVELGGADGDPLVFHRGGYLPLSEDR
jgi:3-hydroxy-9,10-secoandrosta-1,3,5(10)-triene-9,17-dione monooxygenase reductase component